MFNVQSVDSKVLIDIIREFRYVRNCTPVAHNENQAQLLGWFAEATLSSHLANSARKDGGPHPAPPN